MEQDTSLWGSRPVVFIRLGQSTAGWTAFLPLKEEKRDLEKVHPEFCLHSCFLSCFCVASYLSSLPFTPALFFFKLHFELFSAQKP